MSLRCVLYVKDEGQQDKEAVVHSLCVCVCGGGGGGGGDK